MITKNIFKLVNITILSVFFCACDKIETPIDAEAKKASENIVIASDISLSYEELENYQWDTVVSPSNRNTQFILLEEFTGHTCANCPPGSKELLRLDSIYGDQLVPLSVHAGSFARPQDNPDGSYATDHRVPEIVEGKYLAKLGITAFPTGMIQGDGVMRLYANWEAELKILEQNQPKAEVQIKNLYNAQLGIIRTIVDYEWLESLNDDYNLQVFLKEDHVVDWQTDGNFDNPKYDHRHLLQKVVNALFKVPAEQAIAGAKGKKEYIYKTDQEWDMQNVYTIAFLYRTNEPYAVVQVNEAAVVK